MHTRNVPRIDAGYWAAIVAASMCGTNAGDLAAGPLGLGHVRGIIDRGGVPRHSLGREGPELDNRRVLLAGDYRARTMATNIADFATHDMKVSYPVFVLGLLIFMVLMLWADRLRGARTTLARRTACGSDDRLALLGDNADGRRLGTALGDWFAEDQALNLGFIWASVLGTESSLPHCGLDTGSGSPSRGTGRLSWYAGPGGPTWATCLSSCSGRWRPGRQHCGSARLLPLRCSRASSCSGGKGSCAVKREQRSGWVRRPALKGPSRRSQSIRLPFETRDLIFRRGFFDMAFANPLCLPCRSSL